MQNTSRPRLRSDFARQQHSLGDTRPAERVMAHYILERKLSDRLRHTPRESRSRVYAEVYRELFTALPDHPQHRARPSGSADVSAQLHRLANKLQSQFVFLEIGCGDAALGFAAARRVQTVYGLDVTDTLINFAAAPPNFEFLHTGGTDIPLPDGKVDFAYSNQLLEHLHPEDTIDHLKEIYRVLKPGGRYMCITPSRVTGPHDISCYFDYQATGLHLQEYDYGTLCYIFRNAGFQKFSCSASIRGHEIGLPYLIIRIVECGLLSLPAQIRARLTRPSPIQALMGLTIIAAK
jgi:SAM-dependent methyltransferase